MTVKPIFGSADDGENVLTVAGPSNTVTVSSVLIGETWVCGWANYPQVNLYNGASLLALPVQTDPLPIKKAR